jgi:hypothetical protein
MTNYNTLRVIGAALLVVGTLYAQEQPKSAGDKVIIDVSEASYGLNRMNNAAGNATQYLKESCDGKTSCSFPVSKAASKIGDHAPGQTKDFDYVYVCGNEEKKGHVEGEAVGKTAFLTCGK